MNALALALAIAAASPTPAATMPGMAMPADPTGPLPHATQVFKPRVALPELPLQQSDNRRFELADLKGKWIWLYLGYTNCPDACPLTMGYLAGEYRLLRHPERVQPVFVSVDPARDTTERLAMYVHYFHPAFIGVSGEPDELTALAKALGTRFVIDKPEKPGEAYTVEHPDLVFLIDPDGNVAGVYKPDALMGGGSLATDTDLQPAPGQALAMATTTAPPVLGTAAALCGGPTGGAPSTADTLMARARTLGSGTSVLPAASPMRMWGWSAGDWVWMAHGFAVLGGDQQYGKFRGTNGRAAENALMLMGTRPWGPGLLDLHLMGSLEPLTVPPGGTPQLFQLGETYQGNPIADAQHPHDLIDELAARYTWNLDARTALFLYGGPAGEPALGPVTYMHRPSAAENRWAPLGHHQQDSTHVSYGVATVGVRRDDLQWEVSAFNGREPDENRFNLELAPLNSYSTRLSWFPGANWALQGSIGRINDMGAWMLAQYGPMPGMPDMGDQLRMTASALNVTPVPGGLLSTQLVWGEGLDLADNGGAAQSYGLEGEWDGDGGHHVYGRYELADREGLAARLPRVSALTLGYLRDLGLSDRVSLGVGLDATVYAIDSQLVDIYGFNPFSFRVYMRLAPPMMAPGSMDAMAGMGR